MSSKDILTWVDVGQISAERDENLIKYFYDAGVSKQVIDGSRHFLILGRKGAGKTAVFLHMKQKPLSLFKKNDLVVPMSLVNYSWNAHALLAKDEKAASMTQRDSWRFVIAVESIRAYISHCQKSNLVPNEKIKEAASQLEKIFSKPLPSWTELLGEKLFSLSKLKLPGGGLDPANGDLSGSLGEVQFEEIKIDASLKANLSKNLDRLTEYLEAALIQVPRDFRIFLIFDRLDEAWTKESIETCKEIITGLLQASEYVLGKFSGVIRPIVFLREDIFPTLSLNDRNKLREDCGAMLMWDSASLEHMILSRVNFFASRANVLPVTKISELFDRSEMRSRTTPQQYITKRTFMRPRDIVAFYGKIIASMKDIAMEENNTTNGSPNRTRLSVDSIYEAEPIYSEYLYGEIIDEWGTQEPKIHSYLNAFSNVGTAVFKPENFFHDLEMKGIKTTKTEQTDILRFLFENSFIGFKVGKSANWRFKCFYQSQGFLDSTEYKIHSGLIRRLNLKEGTIGGDEE